LTKWATPKTNIIICLDCGSFHEKGSICGKCYQKVKVETALIHEEIFKKNEFKNAYPTKEIGVKYANDPKNDAGGKVIVEIPKNRPAWFDNNLLTRVNSKN
jgi:large subunit ribosomal protein L32